MTKLNERIANVPERIFILAQLALGLLLAAGGGYCILRFGNDGEHFNSLGLAAALVLCGGLPTLSAAVSSVRRVAARRDHRRPRCGPRHLRRDALRLNPSMSGMSRWK